MNGKRAIYIFVSAIIAASVSINLAYSQTVSEGTYTGAEFLNKVSNNSIKLIGDVTITSQITITTPLTIDLNGHVLQGDFGNSAPGEGYLIRINGVSLTIKNSSSEQENHAIDIYDGTRTHTMNFTGGIIANKFNRAIAVTGTNASTRGTCTISNCKIVGCSTSGSGAAINIFTYGGKVSINNVEICYNYATGNGAAIYGIGATITNSKLQFNKAGGETVGTAVGVGGGAISIPARGANHSTEANSITGSTISHNYTPKNGGGIYSKDAITITNSVIEYNYAMATATGATTDTGRGGGFYFSGGKEFVLDNTKVLNNAAMLFGGGGQIESNASLVLRNESAIDRNQAVIRGGGALHMTSGAKLTLNDGTSISNNRANGWGGAIHGSRDCTINLIGGTMSENAVNGRGGAINVSAGSALTLGGTTISKNTAQEGYNHKYSTVTTDFTTGKCTWTPPTGGEDSTIPAYGGGVAVDAGKCIIDGSVVSGNRAAFAGGGIALIMDSYKNNNGTIIDGSIAPTLILNRGEISSNSTDGKGGGVYVMKNNETEITTISSATINGGSISGNTSKEDGGGIYLDDGNVTVTQGEFSGNEAKSRGGALYVNSGTVSLNKVAMNSNTATGDGGGLYLGSGTLSIGDDAGNTVKGNSAANGAGVCIADGSLSVNKCDISYNIASNYGGGVYVMNTSPTNITLSGGGVFEHNSAKAGGGLAVGGAINLSFEGSIQSNKATNGGGIYLFKGSSGTGPTLRFQGGYIRNNQATGNSGATGNGKTAEQIGGFGGGIFLDAGSTFTTNITGNAVFGFYGNMANKGADDIFANGSSTSITIPYVANMRLNDYDVQTNELYWVEDFVNEDTGYNQLTSGNGENDYPDQKIWRYRELLNQNSTYIPRVEVGNSGMTLTGYTCLTLGYSLVFVEVTRVGLKSGDTAPYQISYKKNDTKTPYNKIIFIGQEGDVPLTRKIALPSGDWIFEELNWGWKYDHTKAKYKAWHGSGTPVEYPNYIDIQTNQNTKIKITNYQIENANSQVGFEYNVINRLKND